MTFSELLQFIHNFEEATMTPSSLGVQFGCDCGCGGDTYTKEAWDKAEEASEKAVAEAKDFCTKHGFYYDLLF